MADPEPDVLMDIFFERAIEEDFEKFYILKCDDENIFWTGYIKAPEKKSIKIVVFKSIE